QATLLRELLRIDLHYRRLHGESPMVEEYERRFKGHKELVRALFPAVPVAVSGTCETGPCTPPAPPARPAENRQGPERKGAARPLHLKLPIPAGPGMGKVFSFRGHDTFLVGRSKRCHLRLPSRDKYCSRFHFLVEVNPPLCRLVDMGSNNGTYVNSRPVT